MFADNYAYLITEKPLKKGAAILPKHTASYDSRLNDLIPLCNRHLLDLMSHRGVKASL